MTKSCGRTLRILEYIDDVKRAVSEVELVDGLGYPQSSVRELLRSMVRLGYLHWDAETHLYLTTPRVQLLGHWLQPDILQEGPVLRCVRAIAELTGHSTILATRQGMEAVYIHVVKSIGTPTLTMGTMLPLVRSSTGIALLSLHSDDVIRLLVRRANAECTEPQDVRPEADILDRIEQVRANGYSTGAGPVNPGSTVVSIPLPPVASNMPLAISLGGPHAVMAQRQLELVRIMQTEIARIA